MKPSALRIAVLGHYGNDNLGDEAIIQAVIENLRLRVPHAEIICFSANPANTTWRHGVPAYPISRGAEALAVRRHMVPGPTAESNVYPAPSAAPPAGGLKARLKSFPGVRVAARSVAGLIALPATLLEEWRFIQLSRKHLRATDLLLISGSNQFLDSFGGVWRFPYAMLKWALLGRMAGAKVAFVSVGAGPLSSPVSRLFVRLAMRAAHEVSFRDEASRQLAVCSWAGQGARVAPDLAFSLPLKPHTDVVPGGAGKPGKLSVGVNPMPVYDGRYWPEADESAYGAYVGQLATFCAYLETEGYPWYFYSTQPKDANVMNDVVALLHERGRAPAHLEDRMFNARTVDELVQRISQTEILVATRFHGVVLSLAAGRPALGICYHRKTADVLDSVGLNQFHMHIDSLDAAALARMLQALELRHTEVQDLVRENARKHRQELDAQYDRLIDLVPDARQRGVQAQAAAADVGHDPRKYRGELRIRVPPSDA